jgi:hypothetical protein
MTHQASISIPLTAGQLIPAPGSGPGASSVVFLIGYTALNTAANTVTVTAYNGTSTAGQLVSAFVIPAAAGGFPGVIDFQYGFLPRFVDKGLWVVFQGTSVAGVTGSLVTQ